MSDDIRYLLAEHITKFAENLFEAASDNRALHDELDRFLNFFCGALEAASRDGRSSVLSESLN